jgi:nicotinamidase-related amidase
MARDFEDHCWKDVVDAETLQVYRDLWARETYVGANPAMIAVDLYNSAYEGGPLPVPEANKLSPGSCGKFAWEAIEPTKKLFAAVRAVGIPIVHLTRAVRPGVDQVQSTAKPIESRNKAPFDIREEFAPLPGELVIYKELASGFFGTPLGPYLRKMRVDSLIICGESTSGCVRATAWEGYSHGFHVTLVEECCFDRSLLSHKINLFDLHHKYADVMHLEDVLAEIDTRTSSARRRA